MSGWPSPKARAKAKSVTCPVCGVEFVRRRIGQKVCSQSCSGRLVASTGAGGRATAKPKVTKVCVTCGIEFEVFPAYAGRRKACSVACAAKAKRGAKPERRGKGNPNYRNGSRTGGRDQEAQARWRSAAQRKCQHPGCTGHRGRLALHHIVYRQHIVLDGGDLWDPRNAMTLCTGCHTSHHNRGNVIPLAAVPSAAVEFATELMGADRADEYLRRRYAVA